MKCRVRSEVPKVHCNFRVRPCLNIHLRRLSILLCGIFSPNSGRIPCYASFIWFKSPTNRKHI
ncbi:DUF6783 domain-containing protein [Enterocloster citroniae]|uniref:DUF6783 domain-containing protein n=1 Tax=Enterocloster citroniae TaxID=358743 RepID=UPI00349EB633